ncbi:MAG: helix-turn-helix domain-containing protein [Chloroflexi bacterium]|nr:helix-turn-helix domain-containing protein [Chloroflexota bacterium]
MSDVIPELVDLESTLRALGNRYRLEILSALGHGASNATALARTLGMPRLRVERHLAVLTERHLVRLEPSKNGRVYALDREQAARLNATFVSVVGRIDMGTGAGLAKSPASEDALSLPPAPEACRKCHNASFVRDVLDELDVSIKKAREYDVRLRQMSSQVLTAQEAERKRIARELHDDTAQALTSVLVRLRVLERSADDEATRAALAELRTILGGALEGVRALAIDLRPRVLDDLGLETALETQVRDFIQRWGIDATLLSDRLGRLPTEIELVFYRVAQEALSNIAKHARASRVEIRLTKQGCRLRMLIEDDGCGFNADAATDAVDAGLGLFGMKERLALVGGTLGVESVVGAGTRVSADVMLPVERRD